MFSEPSVELTIEHCIIPASVGCMFRKLNHVLVAMLVVLHFECVHSEDWVRLSWPKRLLSSATNSL